MKIKNICLSLLAAGFFAASVSAYSSEAVRLYNRGIEDVEHEKFEEAIKNFEGAIFQDKSLKDAYFNLGAIYSQMGDSQKAKDIFSNLLRQDPFDDDATYLLAKLHYDSEDYDMALTYLNTLGSTSVNYSRAQDLIFQINEKRIDNLFAQKKAARTWKQKSLKDFEAPAGVAADSTGILYVANYKDSIVQKILPDGKKEQLINENIVGPVGLAVDSHDNLYVSGYTSGKIVRFSPQGEVKVILDSVKCPYYLSIQDDVLYITEQEENSLIMLNLWEVK